MEYFRHGAGRSQKVGWVLVWVGAGLALGGCGPTYRELRRQGQSAMIAGDFGAAKNLLMQADGVRPREADNLHDLGACSVMIARQRFQQRNHAAAMRELDTAIGFYRQAIDVFPGHQASIEGLSVALKLKGQFDEALKKAQWAVDFVGPSARQYLFLAGELEERGDADAALLRYRQAVAVEPGSFEAHKQFADFLLRHNSEEAAIHHLQAAYRLNPRDKWVTDQLVARRAVPPLAGGKPAAP